MKINGQVRDARVCVYLFFLPLRARPFEYVCVCVRISFFISAAATVAVIVVVSSPPFLNADTNSRAATYTHTLAYYRHRVIVTWEKKSSVKGLRET